MTALAVETVEEAELTLAEVLASPPVYDDPRALWPEKRPTIARQACVDFMQGRPMSDEQLLPCGSQSREDDGCPENQRCLVAKRKEVGSLLYDREFGTTPRSATSSLFPRERLEPCLHYDASLVPSFRSKNPAFYVVNGWDIAWSERTGGDYLAKISSVVNRRTGKKRLLDINRWRALSFREQVSLIQAEHHLYGANMTVIEEAGAQSIWIQETRVPEQVEAAEADPRYVELLANLRGITVVGHDVSQKRDFLKGVPGLILDLEGRRWEFPMMPDSYHHEEMLNFLVELEAFGWNDDKLEGVGEHDDTVMAWWHNSWGLDEAAHRTSTTSSPAGQKLPAGSM